MNAPVSIARYDAIADVYAAEFVSADDPVSTALLDLAGPVAGLRVLDIACGHGRVSRELARRGAQVTGLDISARLLGLAAQAEQQHPLGITYLLADIAAWPGPEADFDVATCSFGLSDIDDLDGCAKSVAQALRPGGRLAISILHPCFGGGVNVSGSWPAGLTYYDEQRWTADAALSTPAPRGRRQPPDAVDVPEHAATPRADAGRAGRARATAGLGSRSPRRGAPAALPRSPVRQVMIRWWCSAPTGR